MNSIYTETIQLQAKRDWFYQFAEKVESDRLFYSINYNLEDESKMIYAELIGDGSSKLIHINLNTNNGIKTGEFNTPATFANIYFQAERIRFFSELDLEFSLTIFKK